MLFWHGLGQQVVEIDALAAGVDLVKHLEITKTTQATPNIFLILCPFKVFIPLLTKTLHLTNVFPSCIYNI